MKPPPPHALTALQNRDISASIHRIRRTRHRSGGLALALVLVLITRGGVARAQNGADDEFKRLASAYRSSLSNIVEEYHAGMLTLAELYSRELIQLAARMSKEKNSAGLEAVRKEAQRYKNALAAEPDPFETVPELTGEDIVKEPEALRLLQENYAGKRVVDDLQRNEKVTEVALRLVGALERSRKTSAEAGREDEAASAKKAVLRLQVAMQRKDFATRTLADNGFKLLLVPPPPDFKALSSGGAAAATPPARNLAAFSLADLAPAVQAFLTRPLEFDQDWPPPISKWVYEGTGNYSHDFNLYRQPGQPDELGIFAHPKTLRAVVRGTIKYNTLNFDNKALSWMGKAAAWTLVDSRDLVCQVVFRTRRPALSEAGGPAGCVAVYSTSEANRVIAYMSVPLLSEETSLRMAKHYSYNRMNIAWEGSKRKRGFTIPDHMPLRVVVGVVGFAAGEQVDATIEVLDCPQVEDMW